MSLEPENLRLVAREPCEACGGTGDIASEDWQEFRSWAEGKSRTVADAENTPEHYFLEVRGYDSVPPMTDDCGMCEEGWRETVIEADALIELVCEWVERPLIPRGDLDEVVDTLKTALTGAASKSQGLGDPVEAGEWLRAVTEAAEALRAVGELRPRRRD